MTIILEISDQQQPKFHFANFKSCKSHEEKALSLQDLKYKRITILKPQNSNSTHSELFTGI